ncbi:hypothetical protein C8F04DRAFT_1061220 [Mycena alexandri]|uniref:Uncharacterized protein n=1 Tax=Mycena alexandri TaxID=1745969 RepID=A0AAD6THD7_9AGAR|nr:hypothetical protein C8F04DRAFT_1061220 [Mycena alexandri]
MLEVEMHSPSFRTTRSVSAKRARSPDSPFERPAKRLSLAIGGPLGSSENPFYHHLGARSSTNTSRHSSEDWVQQAGGLSIDSPLFPSTSFTVLEPAPVVDEGMLVDAEEDLSAMPRRPYLPPLRTQTDAFGFATASPIHAQRQPSSGSSYSKETTPATGSLFLPAINILPATPDLLSRTRPSTPVQHDRDNSFAMSISPTTSYAVLGSPASKKQRFMMGPRADCEKCRLGVKGHWVHLD